MCSSFRNVRARFKLARRREDKRRDFFSQEDFEPEFVEPDFKYSCTLPEFTKLAGSVRSMTTRLETLHLQLHFFLQGESFQDFVTGKRGCKIYFFFLLFFLLLWLYSISH